MHIAKKIIIDEDSNRPTTISIIVCPKFSSISKASIFSRLNFYANICSDQMSNICEEEKKMYVRVYA